MGTVITPRPEQWRFWATETVCVVMNHLATGSQAERKQYFVDHLETLAICKYCQAVTNSITPTCPWCGQETQVSFYELLDHL
jgi:Zn finger protein HypA/HybF involved in hydrogenase expression